MSKIIPVFLPFAGCDNKCIYCNQNAITGVSLDSSIVSEAKRQIHDWLEISDNWDEVAFYGGNFGALSPKLRRRLYNIAHIAGVPNLRYSTRPDTITDELLAESRDECVKVIELGVQSLDPNVLKANLRPYDENIVYEAIDKVSKIAFCGVQLMTGLYLQSNKSALDDAKKLSTKGLEYARIYPTLVFKNTVLAELFREEIYRSQSLCDAILTVTAMYIKFNANGVKVIRMGLPESAMGSGVVLAGPRHESLGDLVKTLCAMLYMGEGHKLNFAGYKSFARDNFLFEYNFSGETPDFIKISKALEVILEDSERFFEGKALELAKRLAREAND